MGLNGMPQTLDHLESVMELIDLPFWFGFGFGFWFGFCFVHHSIGLYGWAVGEN